MEKDIAELFHIHDDFLINLMNELECEEEIIHTQNMPPANYIYHKGRADALREVRDLYCKK